MKNGAPVNAIIIPQGSSDGANRVLAARSESITSIVPINAQRDMLKRISYPKIRLTVCGMISPTNPRRPAKLTAEAASEVDIITPVIRIYLTEILSVPAISSPRHRRLSLDEISCAAITEIKIKIAGISISFCEAKAKPPTEKAVYELRISG